MLQYCEYKINLLHEGVVDKLHKTLDSSNEVIIKLSLKLITELLRDNKAKESALPSFKDSLVDRLYNFISEVTKVPNYISIVQNQLLQVELLYKTILFLIQ